MHGLPERKEARRHADIDAEYRRQDTGETGLGGLVKLGLLADGADSADAGSLNTAKTETGQRRGRFPALPMPS